MTMFNVPSETAGYLNLQASTCTRCVINEPGSDGNPGRKFQLFLYMVVVV